MLSSAPTNWRNHQEISKYLGRVGTVIASTLIHVSDCGMEKYLPYGYVIVDLGKEKKSFVAINKELLPIGTSVEIVMRKIPPFSTKEIIHYGLKVKSLKE